jgi:hypothetical protein
VASNRLEVNRQRGTLAIIVADMQSERQLAPAVIPFTDRCAKKVELFS